ncbi:alanyl-tRNA synthetase domain-containing protein [Phlebopus sp. FC_14]|nr:alanyl-tRNA synthetase domain-containing protein [Phlebopus sp. FC_14]
MAASAIVLAPSATPPSYHRIVSPTLKVPSDPSRPIPVGLLACQRDPLLRRLETSVVSCTVSQVVPPPNGRKGRKAPSQAIPVPPTLELILHDTVVFPEGGGQPSDTGLIETADGRTWKVMQAKRHGGHAVHYVQASNTEEDALKFAPGTKVVMTMHTSQHLLSAVLERRLNIPTLSWSVTETPAPCYVELARSMTVEEIQAIQTEANRYVFEGRSVYVEVQEMESASQSGEPVSDTTRGFNKAIPADYTGGIMRVVIIDKIDRNPCCGTHWPTLHNLQLFLLPQTETLARSTTTSARLYFLAGQRLITHLTTTHMHLASAAGTLSCGAPQVPARIEQVVDERKKAEKRVDELESELAKHIALGIREEMHRSPGDKMFTKHLRRVDDSINLLGFLSAIASSLAAVVPSDRPYLLILSSTPSSQTIASTSVLLVFGSDEKQVKAAGEQLKVKLNIKGGGKGIRWSGKLTGVWKDGREDVMVSDILKAVAE